MRLLNYISAVTLLIASSFAAAGEINFDTTIRDIFQSTITADKFVGNVMRPEMNENIKLLSKILKKFEDHEMALSNVVYRSDLNVFRITWADRENKYVVKAAFKPKHDNVLFNSSYADKNEVVDVKIMYERNGSYEYLRIQKGGEVLLPEKDSKNNAHSSKHYSSMDLPGYFIETKLKDEQCGYCHILAQNDGSPSGLFFVRYDHNETSSLKVKAARIFDESKFSEKKKKDASLLGLPEMGEDFLYYASVLSDINIKARDMNQPDTPELRNERLHEKIYRSLIELPQLLEVLARDNHKSYCISIDNGKVMSMAGHGRNDYICADNATKTLKVKLTNGILINNKSSIEYSEPYFAK